MRRLLRSLCFLLLLTACGGSSDDVPVEGLRGPDGELLGDGDFAAPPVSESAVSTSQTPEPDTLAMSDDGQETISTSAARAVPGSPSHRCGSGSAIVEVGNLTEGAAPKFVIVAPIGLIEPGGLSPVPDTPDEGQGITLCIDELEADGNVASCGVVVGGNDFVIREQQARRVTFTWLSEVEDDHSYTSPPALLFDECPDLDTSDPLLHANVAELSTSIVKPTIPALHIEDAFMTSMVALVRIDDEPLAVPQCSALALTAERGQAALQSLYAAYHPQAVPYPSNIEYSADNVADARKSTESFLDANAVAIREFEGNGIQTIHRAVHLNGIIWRRLLDNLDEDLGTNGEVWFRWKLGRQLGVSHGLSDTAHHIEVMADLASTLCEGVEIAPGGDDDAAAAMCVVVADMYQSRYESRLASRAGDDNYFESTGMYDRYLELEEQFPADSNPFFSADAAVALVNTEGDLNSEIRGIWPIGVRVLPWIEDLEGLHTFARTCPQIPSEHIELPTILEELDITTEELIQLEQDSKLNYVDFDIEAFKASVRRLSPPDGWQFTTRTLDDKLDQLFDEREETSVTFGFRSADPDDFFNVETFPEVGPAVHEMMTNAGFARTDVICDNADEFEFIYESADGSTGVVYIWGWSAATPPAFVTFELPEQSPSERLSGCL